jgi:competence CoiA-like predicted nuclease
MSANPDTAGRVIACPKCEGPVILKRGDSDRTGACIRTCKKCRAKFRFEAESWDHVISYKILKG